MKKLLLIGMLFGTSVHAVWIINATKGPIEVMLPQTSYKGKTECPKVQAVIGGGTRQMVKYGVCNVIELNFRQIGTFMD